MFIYDILLKTILHDQSAALVKRSKINKNECMKPKKESNSGVETIIKVKNNEI